MLIDSHAHIDLPDFNEDREQVLARAHDTGVSAIINIGLDLESSRASIQLAEQHPPIFTTIGLHPNSASKIMKNDIDLMTELAKKPKVVAVGEIGLDFYRKTTPPPHQFKILQQQLDLAFELGLPVIIHCRQAHKEMLDILSHWVKSAPISAGNRHERGVIHCFSGDTRLAQRYIELGFLISLAGPVTYPSARDAVEVARNLPLDKLVVETDSPFLPPQPHRGQRNEPAYVSLVVNRIAEIRQVPFELIARTTAQNAINLFHLDRGGTFGTKQDL